MAIKPTEIWGVITGDIVRSSSMEPAAREKLLRFFTRDARQLLQDFSPSCRFLFPEIFRGDSWQMAVFPASLALRNGLFLRTQIKASSRNADTRFALGIGTIMFAMDENVGTGYGSAYTLSGALLDRMTDQRMLMRTIKDPQAGSLQGRAMDIIVRFMDERVTQWTSAQARAVLGAMNNQRQEDIARQWRPRAINQQAVSVHLKNANWDLVKSGLVFIENAIGDWDHLLQAQEEKR